MHSYDQKPPSLLLPFLFCSLFGCGAVGVGFFMLYTVEYEVNTAQLCRQAPRFSASSINPEAQRYPLIALSGTIVIEKKLTCEAPLIPKPYLACAVKTEVYAWEEHQKPQLASNEERQPPLYLAHWTTTPQQTNTFEIPEGHENPEIHQAFQTWIQPSFKLGAYEVKTMNLQLPGLHKLKLTEETIEKHTPEAVTNAHVYESVRAVHTPTIGAKRRAFSVLDVDGMQATLFCKVHGNQTMEAEVSKIVSFETPETIERLCLGSYEEVVQQLSVEYKNEQRIKNLGAWFLLFIGFSILFAPLAAFAVGTTTATWFRQKATFTTGAIGATAVFCIAKILTTVLINPVPALGLMATVVYLGVRSLTRTPLKNNGF